MYVGPVSGCSKALPFRQFLMTVLFSYTGNKRGHYVVYYIYLVQRLTHGEGILIFCWRCNIKLLWNSD